MTDDARYVRLSITTHSTASGTVKQQALFEMRGWRRVIARLLGRPVTEWRDINTAGMESQQP